MISSQLGTDARPFAFAFGRLRGSVSLLGSRLVGLFRSRLVGLFVGLLVGLL